MNETPSAAPPSSGSALARTLNIFFLALVHSSLFFVLVVPFSWSLVLLWAISHFGRILGITLAFHRHLAHGAFEMGRVTRFSWAWVATSAMQTGPLWWAGTHADHHRYADREGDPHSPRLRGFLGAHVGWILDGTSAGSVSPDNPVVRRFARYPEIRFLERFYYVPPLLLAVGLFAVGGWPWLVWGFGLATTTAFHATFAINSVNHLWGTRRFATPDDSRNNLATALLALGEGWHNNHHRYPLAARNGFYWWELDATWWEIGRASCRERVSKQV